jgi:hypothetical protein
MITKYKAASRLGKVFIWLSLGLACAGVALYAMQVSQALNMDPNSYNCVHDSMMKQICADPYGTSVFWAGLQLVFLAWPLLLAWMITGMVLISRRRQRSQSSHDHPAKEKEKSPRA